MARVHVQPWAGADSAWERLRGRRMRKELIGKVRKVNIMALDGTPISDRHGRQYTLRVQRKPLDGYAETHLDGMQTSAKTYHRVTAMHGDVPVATVGIVKVSDEKIRGISGEVDAKYAGSGIFSKLCDAACSQFPKGTQLEGGIGSIESLVSLVESAPMKKYLASLPKSKQQRIQRVIQNSRALRARVGRVDFGHKPGERPNKSRLGYGEWQLLSGAVVNAINKGIKLDPVTIDNMLLAKTFRSNFHDFKLAGGRFLYKGTNRKIALPIMTAVKWKS